MRYLFPPTLNTVRSPMKDADANVAFKSPGLRQSADSTASTQCHMASAERGSRSMNSRIRFPVTTLNFHVPMAGTICQDVRGTQAFDLRICGRIAVMGAP